MDLRGYRAQGHAADSRGFRGRDAMRDDLAFDRRLILEENILKNFYDEYDKKSKK